jgi:RES domain-containing protein
MSQKKFKVALSFAGENREYVSQVASILRMSGISVFYDEFEQADLWGKELIEFLEKIYGYESEYVMMFISKDYLIKIWTNHERKAALNTALKNGSDYILPVRLDDTKLPGLHDSIGFLDGRRLNPKEVCDRFLKKIGVENATSSFRPVTFAYRITKQANAHDLSGAGARAHGGRWNKIGDLVIYAASSRSLAMLEYLNAINFSHVVPANFTITQLAIPHTVHIEYLQLNDLPEKALNNYWFNMDITQTIGAEWIKTQRACVLAVPSIIVKQEAIYLLNADHPDMQKIRISAIEPLGLDGRLI